MVGIAVHIICNTMIADIHQNKQILAPDGFMKDGLGFSGSEARAVKRCQIAVFPVTVKGGIVFDFVIYTFPEIYQIIVHLARKGFGRFQSYNFERRHRHRIFQFA